MKYLLIFFAVFETELMGIDGVKAPEKIVEKASSSAESKASSAEEKASSTASGVKEAIKSKISQVVNAAKTALADTDDQEHNEL